MPRSRSSSASRWRNAGSGMRRSTAGNAPPSSIRRMPQRSTTSRWPTSTRVNWQRHGTRTKRRSRSSQTMRSSGRTTTCSRKSMTAFCRKTVGSLSLALVAACAACTSYTEIPIETPIQPKLDVSAFQRIFIAGFIAGANEDVDANMETVRLLRSQLRNKGLLRVIDADTLPLLEVARQNAADGNGEPTPDQQAAQPPQDQDKPPVINDEKDLEQYQHLFANVAYWKRIGEEYQQPLIVTGAVLFTPSQAS